MNAEWIGRAQTSIDWITPGRVAAWRATLDHDSELPIEGDSAPLGFHWTLAPLLARESELGPDGHPRRGGFLPPIPLPRRMWAGSRLEFVKPLRVGACVTRVSRIKSIQSKEGRSGRLVFITVRHEVSDAAGLVLSDEHDIVFRAEGARAAAPVRAPAREKWRREIRPTTLLLFRYSAVTFNGHRIHYDHPYATKVEGYPGLVVHGPLIATLLVDLLRRERPDVTLRAFEFRAVRPLYDTANFFTCGVPDEGGNSAKLWTRDVEGAATMHATATW